MGRFIPTSAKRDLARVVNLIVLGWAAAILLRYVAVDHPVLLLGAAIAPWGFVLSATAAAALQGRIHVLVVGFLSAALIGFALPGTVLPSTGCAVQPDSQYTTVYSHNVLFGAADPAEIAPQAASVGADVIVLQEANRAFTDRVHDAVAEGWSLVHVGHLAVLSRFELSDAVQRPPSTSVHALLAVEVETPHGSLPLLNVHTIPPHVPGARPTQRAQFVEIGQWGEATGGLALGDFNATTADRRLLAAVERGGYADSHEIAGCGVGATWSPAPSRVPAILRLDRAYVSRDWAIESYEVLGYAGSDHKAIAVQVRPR